MVMVFGLLAVILGSPVQSDEIVMGVTHVGITEGGFAQP